MVYGSQSGHLLHVLILLSWLEFSGLPGSAKSALCKELLQAPGGMGDERPIQSLMGDLVKGTLYSRKTVYKLAPI